MSALDGLLTFFASHHAVRAEKLLRTDGFAVELIPGPKELSPNCGVALRFELERRDEALGLLGSKKVEVDEVHHYVPRTDAWKPARTGRRFFRRRDE
ncbi:MAG TPA: DUF3343 domain-containing protein [Acidimicrobiia bacterium]|nr:DUF3343 domain-containing protein [Acidimicrobiia bacterium]